MIIITMHKYTNKVPLSVSEGCSEGSEAQPSTLVLMAHQAPAWFHCQVLVTMPRQAVQGRSAARAAACMCPIRFLALPGLAEGFWG